MVPNAFNAGTFSDADGVLHLEKTADQGIECLWLREPYTLTATPDRLGGGDFTFNGQGNIDAGTARYMMLKIKSNAASGIKIALGTTGWTYENYANPQNQGGIFQDIILNSSATQDGEWTVYVIDLDKFGDKVRVDADGNRIIDSFKIETTGNVKSGQYIDIAYVAFADDWSEVAAQETELSVFKYIYAYDKSSNIDKDGKAVNVNATSAE